MTTVPRESSSPTHHARLIAFWMIVQLAALALATSRVSLSARFFQPAERMAVEEMLVAQLLASSLTFPLLLRGWFNAIVIPLTAVPMLLLANALSRYAMADLWPAMLYVELCLLAMAAWAQTLRTLRSQLIGVCVAGGFTIFLTVLWYLSREYQPDSRDWLHYFGPIVAALRLLDQSGRIWEFAALPAVFGLVALASRFVACRRACKT
jgi:hypothetical protein